MSQKPVNLVNAIDAILPQTQCGQCGYDGCTPYAMALVYNSEAINRCPPGGQRGIEQLATLLKKNNIPALNTECGIEKKPHTVTIHEELCIGCTKCITACPVDAIIGTKKNMHTVITNDCTGCELCIPACPMDCMSLIPSANLVNATSSSKAYLKKNYLIKKEREHKKKKNKTKTSFTQHSAMDLKENILAAIQRRKNRYNNVSS